MNTFLHFLQIQCTWLRRICQLLLDFHIGLLLKFMVILCLLKITQQNQYKTLFKNKMVFSKQCLSPGDHFTKVIVNRKSKITLKISLRARIRAFHKLVLSVRVTTYYLRQVTSPIMEVKRYYIVSYILYIIKPTAQKLIRSPGGSMS